MNTLNVVALVASGIALVVYARGCTDSRDSSDYKQLAAARAASAAAANAKVQQDARRTACIASRTAMLAKNAELGAAGKHWEAARAIEDCHTVLADANLAAAVATSEQKFYLSEGLNKKLAASDRASALMRLARDYPDAAKPYVDLIEPLQKKAAAEQAAEDKRKEAALRAERRKRGVSIGMTQEEVLQSSWGKPEHINRSTYSFGVHEQWVYGSGNYLYFKDGILDSIQN